ncbi:MAG: aminopeptidase [Candidatus Aenigmarchaeota archaeon]|nr:aminopeptidase [Candidatus Aenigmarchaeota archaeon]
MAYQPPQKILDKYADLLVNFALGGGKGVKPGEVVFLQVPECAKPMLAPLQRAVLKAKAHAIIQYLPEGISRDFFEIGSEKQFTYFPKKFMKSRVDTIDHNISIISETNPHELEGINPKKIMARQNAWKPYLDWINEKENKKKFTWTLALYGTEGMAKEAKMTLKEYWAEIIKACYLDNPNPIKKWKEISAEVNRIKSKLDKLKIKKVRVEARGTDLTIGIGKKRKWCGCEGRNIPSFEIYTSPDCRDINGHISFNVPLYRFGNLIKDIQLDIEHGKIVRAKAKQGEKFLKEMIKTPGGDHIGEFSMTDKRLSRITKYMATTLFDENVGGKFGNSHLALGKSLWNTYDGDLSKTSKGALMKLGFNDSPIHVDIFNTENRKVTATLEGGKEVVIYKDGKFQV